jgi:hypothetical protein
MLPLRGVHVSQWGFDLVLARPVRHCRTGKPLMRLLFARIRSGGGWPVFCVVLGSLLPLLGHK